MQNAIDTYRQDVVFSLPREQLLLRLYDALLLRIEDARSAFSTGQRERAGRAISKAFDIVAALRDALDPSTGAECVPRLDRLYRTVSSWLLEANLTQSTAPLESSRRVLSILKEGWNGAVRACS